MGEPVEVHRKEVTQRIQIAQSQGGWEGTHTDFKRQLDSTPRAIAKAIRHMLAFANTPRRTDAYMIFGVAENKEESTFQHVGVAKDGFPPAERIEALLHEYTALTNVVIDTHFLLDGKRTPFVAIPIQYEGPYALRRPWPDAKSTITPDDIVCRYGSNSLRAAPRDVRRMRADWDNWFLDCRYEKSATSLHSTLKKHFPKHASLTGLEGYVRLIYNSEIRDEFGIHHVPVLVHAYWGFDPVPPAAVERMVADEYKGAYQKTIIGSRFEAATLEAGSKAAIRCVPLEEIYFVNDPYAEVCRKFVAGWARERAQRGLIVDLDYSPFSGAKGLGGPTPRSSILSFLEEQIQSDGRVAVVIHGDFGCGKTTTAKQFVANLAEDYLRGQTNLKVLYVDVNNIDIRARRDECLESELRQFNLTRDQTEALVSAVRADEIQLVFDGVDEMAKPVTTAGRREGLELLRDIGNRRTASYFIRSSYYLSLSELIADFANLADHDFAKDASKVVAAELRSLSQQQTMEYLQSRLDGDVVVAVRSGLKSLGLTSLLGDPLIVSYLADLVEDQGPEAVVGFQGTGQKAAFLSYLVEQLLEREQRKRQRQTNFTGGFSVFRKVLRRVAFDMVCSALSSLTPEQLTAFAQQAVSGQDAKEEAVNAFRTMSWIHGAEDGRLAFRHEALTVVCAAQHVCVSLKTSDALSLRLWNSSAPLADVVADYAANIASGRELLNAVGLLGGETILNVRQLAVTVLRSASGRQDLEKVDADQLDPASIAAIVRGMASNALVASTLAKLLLESAGQKRRLQIGLPLLYKLTQLESQEAFNLAVEVLTTLMESAKTFAQLLRDVKGDATRLVDLMVTKRLDIEQRDLVSILSYEPLFRRILLSNDADRRMRQQAERAMKAVENERSLLEKRQRRDRQRSR